MPRRPREEVDWRLWAERLKPWMREALKVLLEAERPMATGEILDALAERLDEESYNELTRGKTSGYHKLLRFLKRLQAHGIARRARIGYYYRYAWRIALPERERERLKKVLTGAGEKEE